MHPVSGQQSVGSTCVAHPRVFTALALALWAGGAHARDDWHTSGDVRVGYVASETRTRNGARSEADSLRARVRLRLRRDLGGGWQFGGRVAARLDTDQDKEEFWIRTYGPDPSGLGNGQGTIDEAYLDYRPDDAAWSLRMGRFQAAWGLDDVMKKSLDQNDSTNFDITWTDGLWLQWRFANDWTTHLVLRHNDRRGPTGTLRRPLDFSDSDSRIGMLAVAESRSAVGPLIQRAVTINWLPSALHAYGAADPRTPDYLAVTGKATAQWPLGEGGTQLRLGGELGYAAKTPRREAMNSGTGDADSLSWQASLNVMAILPGHDLGIVRGRVKDGWLISSDFRPNDTTTEIRWAWQATPAWQLDARVRRREEIHLPSAAPGARRDDDIYLRATVRF